MVELQWVCELIIGKKKITGLFQNLKEKIVR